MIGFRWHEHVCTDDLPRLIAWFHQREDEPIEFRCLVPHTRVWVRCVWTKQRFRGEQWLVIGDAFEIPDLPAPPCLVMELPPARARNLTQPAPD